MRKSKFIGSFLLIVTLLATVMANFTVAARAQDKNIRLSNEVKVLDGSSINKQLKAGDTFKLVLSVKDSGIPNPESAKVTLYRLGYNEFTYGDNQEYKTTSISHDEANSCYIVDIDGTITDESNGIWYLGDLVLTGDNQKNYEFSSNGNRSKYQHYVIDSTVTNQLVLNCYIKEMKVGESFQLKANILPSNEAAEGVEWYSENPSYATVDSTGNVTTKGIGEAYIYANYKGQDVRCDITVVDENGQTKYHDNTNIDSNISIISNTASKRVLMAGDQFQMVLSVPDDGIDNATSAIISGPYRGYDSGSEITMLDQRAASVVHDTQNHCYIITLNKTITNEKVGEYIIEYVTLKNDQEQYYHVSDYSADYDNGVFYVVEDKSKEYLVVNANYDTIKTNETYQLKATLLPSFQEVNAEWTCNKNDVATVDNHGLVTPLKKGDVLVTATYNGMENTSFLCFMDGKNTQSVTTTDNEKENNDQAAEAGENQVAQSEDPTTQIEEDAQTEQGSDEKSNQSTKTGETIHPAYIVLAGISTVVIIFVVVLVVRKKHLIAKIKK